MKQRKNNLNLCTLLLSVTPALSLALPASLSHSISLSLSLTLVVLLLRRFLCIFFMPQRKTLNSICMCASVCKCVRAPAAQRQLQLLCDGTGADGGAWPFRAMATCCVV